MKKQISFLFLIFFTFNPFFSQTQQTSTNIGSNAKKILNNAGETGKKVVAKVMELFALPHIIPKNYIPMSKIELLDKDNFNNITIQKNRIPELELRVIYPRITPDKGFVSFQLGDFNYYRYIKNIKQSDIEYIKLISDSGEECLVEKYRILPKKELERHFVFLLDHSGSMGDKRARELQKSLANTITNYSKDKQNNTFSIFKFSYINGLIVSSNKVEDINNALMPPNGLEGYGGGTAIKDALISAIEHVSLDHKSQNKVVVIFTDGQSNSDMSCFSMEEIIRKALENNINIITVGFGSYLDPKYLENISNNSGGNLYHIYDPREFDILFKNIFEDIQQSYDLEFSPCMFGEQIKIEIKLSGFEKPIVGSTVFRSPPIKGFSIDLNILFDNASFVIKPEYYDKLDHLIEYMKNNKSINILIEGHTDKLGVETSNKSLSLKRAQSVKSYLINKNIESSRISVKGYGSTNPAYDYLDNSNINPLNRRIQIVIN